MPHWTGSSLVRVMVLVACSVPMNQCWLIVNWPLRTNFMYIYFIKTKQFSLNKMHLKMSSPKWSHFVSASVCWNSSDNINVCESKDSSTWMCSDVWNRINFRTLLWWVWTKQKWHSGKSVTLSIHKNTLMWLPFLTHICEYIYIIIYTDHNLSPLYYWDTRIACS